jgi:transcription antitermination factor NusA-like protein
MRGSRVQAVVQELRGEKIDIVPFNEDPARFVCSAISPAEVNRVLVDEGNMSMELIVPDDQLSLAIGRGGQNVRLAAQLTGWDLDIISQGRLKAVMEEARQSLLEYEGITEDMIGTLFSLGYTKLNDIGDAEISEIAQIPGFGEERASIAISVAKEINSRSIEEELQGTEQFEEIKVMTEVAEIHTESATSLYRGGYFCLDLIYFEEDPERMDTRTGLGLKNCKMLIHAVNEHVNNQDDFDADKMEAKRESLAQSLDVLKPISPIRLQGRRVGDPGSGEVVEKTEETAAPEAVEPAPADPSEEVAAEETAAPEAVEPAPADPSEEVATEETAASEAVEPAPADPSEEVAAEEVPGDSEETAETGEVVDVTPSIETDVPVELTEDEETEQTESTEDKIS